MLPKIFISACQTHLPLSSPPVTMEKAWKKLTEKSPPPSWVEGLREKLGSIIGKLHFFCLRSWVCELRILPPSVSLHSKIGGPEMKLPPPWGSCQPQCSPVAQKWILRVPTSDRDNCDIQTEMKLLISMFEHRLNMNILQTTKSAQSWHLWATAPSVSTCLSLSLFLSPSKRIETPHHRITFASWQRPAQSQAPLPWPCPRSPNTL